MVAVVPASFFMAILPAAVERSVVGFVELGDAVVVAVHASPRTRYERLRARRRPGNPETYEEFKRRDMVELGFGLSSVIALADHVIVNEGSIEETRECVRRILEHLVVTHGSNHR
ncbi:MAG: hypothetical protein QXJ97_07260 [Desulfurococcaceae archaeon]